MNRFIFILIFISLSISSYSQNFDLIVNTKGDSIACQIDSITESYIYFEMKFNSQWIHTSYRRSDISNYKYDAIDKKFVKFESGTTKITPYKQTQTVTEFRKNALYLEGDMLLYSLYYERLTPLRNHNALTYTLGAGIDIFAEPIISGKLIYLLGGPNHYFETGLCSLYSSEGFLGGILLGYRYQDSKGLLLRGPIIITDSLDDDLVWFFMGFSVGFAF